MLLCIVMSVRILGVELQPKKQVFNALQGSVYGVGMITAKKICQVLGIADSLRVRDLTEDQVVRLSDHISSTYTVEGALRREIKENIDRLKHIRCRRGIRLQGRLPVRGQRSKSNARNAKGKAGATAIKRKTTKK